MKITVAGTGYTGLSTAVLYIQWMLKAAVAGLLALSLSCMVCLAYSNTGSHITSTTGATDYVWQASSFTANMTEGIAWKRVDTNGYLSNGGTATEFVDILLMGSSHMEARQVADHKTVCGLLNTALKLRTYNIGTSGHTLLRCVKNLEAALAEYSPSSYVIIETSTTEFSTEEILAALDGTMTSIVSYDSGLIYYLQQIPYFKLAYEKIKSRGG